MKVKLTTPVGIDWHGTVNGEVKKWEAQDRKVEVISVYPRYLVARMNDAKPPVELGLPGRAGSGGVQSNK